MCALQTNMIEIILNIWHICCYYQLHAVTSKHGRTLVLILHLITIIALRIVFSIKILRSKSLSVSRQSFNNKRKLGSTSVTYL
jgi:hypothetical protein